MSSARDTAPASGPLTAQSEPPSVVAPSLAMQGIVKRYGVTTALNGVDFDVRLGEIHALLGENGAGKSTLMHVLSGLTAPNAGEIRLDGVSRRVASPRVARQLGIAMVHQHFTLVPAFTVAENLALDAKRVSGVGCWVLGVGGYSAMEAARPALERAAALGWNLDADARVSELSVGAQQRVEIVKALATDARLLIFDEPTAVLAGDEVEELFTVLRRLRDDGKAVILIAHKLAEILAVADRVTVLRRGNRVASCPVAETNATQLAAWMIGTEQGVGCRVWGVGENPIRPSNTLHPTPYTLHAIFQAVNLVVAGDRGEEAVRGVSLEVGRGEIFGIGGVDGNGQTELAEALVGLRKVKSGDVMWDGKPFRIGVAPTIGYIPQDRRRVGLAMTMTIEDNLLLEAAREPAFRRGPFLRTKALRQLAGDLVRAFDVRTPSVALPASALSGGNQQKIVVARAFRAKPQWIVAVNPTRGLDIGATRFVHEQLRQAKARGAAIVLISTDLDELNVLADRAAILSGGKLSAYAIGQADRTQIGLLLGGLGEMRAQGAEPNEDAGGTA